MKTEQLRKQHIQSFSKLSISERLAWAFAQHRFLIRFARPEAKRANKNLRRHGKRYF